jgi:hypothetical protein
MANHFVTAVWKNEQGEITHLFGGERAATVAGFMNFFGQMGAFF